MAWDAETARMKLKAKIAEQDAARGRPLTDAEKLANLEYAVNRICSECGGDVEPDAVCACGHVNSERIELR